MNLRLDALVAHSPAEIRRRLRHASVLVASAELPLDRVALASLLLRARNHLSGTVRKLDQLLTLLDARSTAATGSYDPACVDSFDDLLTEPHDATTIVRRP